MSKIVHVKADPDDPRGNWDKLMEASRFVHANGGGRVYLSAGLYQAPGDINRDEIAPPGVDEAGA